jgi:hypothetical protein
LFVGLVFVGSFSLLFTLSLEASLRVTSVISRKTRNHSESARDFVEYFGKSNVPSFICALL